MGFYSTGVDIKNNYMHILRPNEDRSKLEVENTPCFIDDEHEYQI